MQDSSTAAVYRSVIDEVITKAKPDVVQEGIDEAVLDELRLLWESKLQKTGVLDPEPVPALPTYRPYAYGQPGRYVYGQGSMPVLHPQGAAAPLPALPRALAGLPMLPQGPATSAVTTYPHPLAGVPQQSLLQPARSPVPGMQGMPGIPQGSLLGSALQQQQPSSAGMRAPYANGTVAGGSNGGLYGGTGAVPGQQPAAAPAAVPSSNSADADSRKRKAAEELASLQRQLQRPAAIPAAAVGSNANGGSIPQQDGQDDGPSGKAAEEGAAEKEEEEKEDNLSDVSSEKDEDEQVPHVVIAQFEKVSHVKTKWKCQLKDGVMKINGREYLFRSANGEMQF